MNPDRADRQIAKLLNAAGQVVPPSSDALKDARERLWSAVADEMRGTGEASAKTTGRETSQPQPTARQRRPARPQQTEQRRGAQGQAP